MKRVITGLALIAAGLIATGVVAGAASADPLRPPGVPANYVLYKTISSGIGECNSAGVSFEQQGLIEAFVCDQIEPPSFNSGGESQLWALLP